MVLKKENPASRMRTKLLKELIQRDLSENAIMKITELLEGLTEQQKEEKAKQILAIMASLKTEEEILPKIMLRLR